MIGINSNICYLFKSRSAQTMAYDVSTPLVHIWRAQEENVGHVALETDKYYTSHWPEKFKTTSQISIHRVLVALGIRSVDGGWLQVLQPTVKANLVLNPRLDIEWEGEMPTNSYPLSHYVSNEDLNVQIESYLRANSINPELVTKARIEESRIAVDYAKIGLLRTEYTFRSEVIKSKESYEWYDKPQSCLSYCFNIVEMARPGPSVCNPGKELFNAVAFTVPWFEENVVRNIWMQNNIFTV